jgi:uncharacterized lipoprotein YehR (DUF1307 family)
LIYSLGEPESCSCCVPELLRLFPRPSRYSQPYQIPISNMPHVTFGEGCPSKKSYEEKRTVIKIPAKPDNDNKKTVVRQRSRTISYKIPDETRKTKPAEKICIERKITYKDLCGNIVKIVYEDECGKVIRTIYPSLPPCPPPPPPKCSPPPPAPSPPKCSSPPVSEPSDISSEDLRNCRWTKVVVKNSRGVVRKILFVDCDGKTMKTEYPEPEPRKRRSVETRRYVVKELDEGPTTRRIVIQKESRESVPSQACETPCETTKTTEKEVEVVTAVKSASSSASASSVSAKEPDALSSQTSASSESTTTRRDSANSSGGKKAFVSAEEVVKDENGVTKRVTYTDSRGRRRTVVYED